MEQKTRRKSYILQIALACVAALVLAVTLVGCSEDEEDVEALIIGEEDEEALSMYLTNGTGSDIEEVAVRESDAGEDEDYAELTIQDEDSGVWQMRC